ncbi:MAG: aminopeptidase [Thiohalophilus sp.]|uniref:aminopeptidase n=1 Tax=Thiohalophilus sp. TaxID=3028392 RepID=UPI00287026B1|nr:aminopeptidase [Thiohalophilus sp.]MDR9435312.1 aminopeptidase [Thiohalophilus sp.]
MTFHLYKFLSLCVILTTLSGCSSLSYYLDAVNGHAGILNHQRPVSEVIADPATSTERRAALLDIQRARQFAVEALQLPDNDSYRYYADIDREYAVWNVIATPELSVEPRQWCFLFAGCLNYRGYFSEQQANEYAGGLEQEGYDTYVAGARAYSTLGWFDDPLLNTMLLRDEARRIGIVFHELAHQKLYLADDPAFNESFAVFIEQEGVRRWFATRDRKQAYARYRRTLERRSQFHALLLATRQQLKKLYASDHPDTVKRRQKQHHFAQLKREYQRLKQQWGSYDAYDSWMQQPLNNAHLALIATYREQVAGFERLLDSLDGDLTAFYQAVEQIARLSPEQRKAALLTHAE